MFENHAVLIWGQVFSYLTIEHDCFSFHLKAKAGKHKIKNAMTVTFKSHIQYLTCSLYNRFYKGLKMNHEIYILHIHPIISYLDKP